VSPLVPVADGALAILARTSDADWLPRWLPRPHPNLDAERVRVRLRELESAERAVLGDHADRPPTLRFGSVRAWVDPVNRAVWLAGAAAGGWLDLTGGTGVVDPAGSPEEGCTLLSIASGLLLASRGRPLIHAGAVRRPDGGVLLLVGDTHSGKTTTTLTLARAPGWSWVSDDQVVLTTDSAGSIEVLGWVRRPHLDRGYLQGWTSGDRCDADEQFLASLDWQPRGPLAGLLLPAVQSDTTSRPLPATAAEGLEALIRQGAWMLAEPAAARATLGLLRAAADTGARRLLLGLDCYGRPEQLVRLVEGGGVPLEASGGRISERL